ncbi:MAG: EamA family transporter [Eubacteriales bacterium]
MKKRIRIKDIIILQAVIMIYTISSVMAKFASGQDTIQGLLVFYGIEIVILGVYALLWQQMIKKFDLSVAYANRAMALLWSAVWAIVIFKETITMMQVLGIVIVIIGTMVINSEKECE